MIFWRILLEHQIHFNNALHSLRYFTYLYQNIGLTYNFQITITSSNKNFGLCQLMFLFFKIISFSLLILRSFSHLPQSSSDISNISCICFKLPNLRKFCHSCFENCWRHLSVHGLLCLPVYLWRFSIHKYLPAQMYTALVSFKKVI